MNQSPLQRPIPAGERLMVALDVPSAAEALRLAEPLCGLVRYFKVGLELFLAGGWDVVKDLGGLGAEVFLDLKMLDIPATVSRALAVVEQSHPEVAFATIHVLDRNFRLPDRPTGGRLKLLVVTVLTSQGSPEGEQVAGVVSAKTAQALELGADGVICSGLEAGLLREQFGLRPLIVTPGIRPAWSLVGGDDQKRIVTPAQAIARGADYLVVGRPIRDNPAGPRDAVQRIIGEIQEALDT
ncbi:MAG: orotidine-5'-phosphate decarboxylase [Deltaproteobacteria bacterium]|nr:orotidine-5'-phosphate decarboxylase [Deltaproteobacteria bacterium]